VLEQAYACLPTQLTGVLDMAYRRGGIVEWEDAGVSHGEVCRMCNGVRKKDGAKRSGR